MSAKATIKCMQLGRSLVGLSLCGGSDLRRRRVRLSCPECCHQLYLESLAHLERKENVRGLNVYNCAPKIIVTIEANRKDYVASSGDDITSVQGLFFCFFYLSRRWNTVMQAHNRPANGSISRPHSELLFHIEERKKWVVAALD